MDPQIVTAQLVEKKSRKTLWVILVVILLILLCIGSCVGLWFLALVAGDSNINSTAVVSTKLETEAVYGDVNSKSKLLAIPITGPILNVKPVNDFLGFATQVTYGYDVKDMLYKAVKDDEIKGVILTIDSPGGTLTGSKAIADGVEYYRKQTGKPVYAHIMGLGASGAYWSAASTDFIISDYGSLIGSIGVILGPFKHYNTVLSEQSGSEGITTKNGIDTFYITSGGYKDLGSPDREMTAIERQSLQDDNDAAYKVFVDFVSSRRNISADIIRNNIKALAFGEQKALDLKLIDKIGSQDDAYQSLAIKAGLNDNNYQVVKVKSTTDFWSLFFSGELMKSLQPNKAETLDVREELSGKLLYMYNDGRYLK